MAVHLNIAASRVLKSAAKHLQVPRVVQRVMFFALDVYYHQSRYLRLTDILKMSQSTHSSVNENEEIVPVELCTYVKVNLLREKNAYLLKELLENVINLCEKHDNVPFINDVKS